MRQLIARCTIPLFAIVLLWMPITTHAAESSWVVWLLNSNSRELVKVTPDGSQSFAWPFAAMPFSTSDVAISPDNRLAAACLMDDTGRWSVGVAEIETGQALANLEYDTLQGCSTTRASFSPDSTRVAFGVVYYLPNVPNVPNTPDAPTSAPVAALHVLDIASGEVTTLDFGLDGLTALFEEQLQQSPTAVLPIVVDFDGETVTFQLSIYAIGGSFVITAEQWTIEPGFSQRHDRFAHPGIQYFPGTGEVVWPDVSNTYPRAQPRGPIPAHNVVRYQGASGDLLTLYTPNTDSPMLVVGVEWANDGAVLLVHLLGEYRPDMSSIPEYWVALDRVGNTADLPADITGFQVFGASQGFFYLSTTYKNDDFNRPTTVLNFATFAADATLAISTTPVWQADSDSWLILSVSPTPSATEFPPFPAIAD